MKYSHYIAPRSPLYEHIKIGLIHALCSDGLLTPAQRDELLRRQRNAQSEITEPPAPFRQPHSDSPF